MNLYDIVKPVILAQWLNLKQENMYLKLTLIAHKLLIKQAVKLLSKVLKLPR